MLIINEFLVLDLYLLVVTFSSSDPYPFLLFTLHIPLFLILQSQFLQSFNLQYVLEILFLLPQISLLLLIFQLFYFLFIWQCLSFLLNSLKILVIKEEITFYVLSKLIFALYAFSMIILFRNSSDSWIRVLSFKIFSFRIFSSISDWILRWYIFSSYFLLRSSSSCLYFSWSSRASFSSCNSANLFLSCFSFYFYLLASRFISIYFCSSALTSAALISFFSFF